MSKTSSPAPRSLDDRSAAISAASSRLGPRAAVMRRAPGLISGGPRAPIRPRVLSLNRRCTVRTSACGRSSSLETGVAPAEEELLAHADVLTVHLVLSDR